jgi:hypothetical protein
VNNVGHFMPGAGPFLRTTEADWEGLYEINLKHILRATHALAPAMVERRSGCIINVSTIETFRGIPGNAIYSTFKTGITAFTRSFALEVARYGVRVNAIAPETTDTDRSVTAGSRRVRLSSAHDPARPLRHPTTTRASRSSWPRSCQLDDRRDGSRRRRAIAASGFYRLEDGSWTNAPIVADAGVKPREASMPLPAKCRLATANPAIPSPPSSALPLRPRQGSQLEIESVSRCSAGSPSARRRLRADRGRGRWLRPGARRTRVTDIGSPRNSDGLVEASAIRRAPAVDRRSAEHGLFDVPNRGRRLVSRG